MFSPNLALEYGAAAVGRADAGSSSGGGNSAAFSFWFAAPCLESRLQLGDLRPEFRILRLSLDDLSQLGPENGLGFRRLTGDDFFRDYGYHAPCCSIQPASVSRPISQNIIKNKKMLPDGEQLCSPRLSGHRLRRYSLTVASID